MKKHTILRQLLPMSLFSLICAGSMAVGQAQTTNFIVAQFDTDATGFLYEYGTPTPTYSWDTNNAITTVGPNNPGSGSVDISLAWTSTGEQVQFDYPFGATLDLNNYTNLSFDIKFDAACATDGAGSYGDLIVTFYATAQGYSADALGTYNSLVSNGTNWIHVSIPINANGNSDYNAAQRMGFKVQQARTGYNIVGTSLFHVDNIILGGNNTPPTPPKMTITPAGRLSPGLLMIPGEVGGDYTRQLVAAQGTSYSWVGATVPVTYSTTITNYPGTANPGFQSVIFMVPPGTLGDPAVDYDAASVAVLTIINNANGTATGSFQFKTNQPTGNSQFGGTGNLANINATNVLGTWSITFNNDTNFTLTGPGGASTNASFPDEPTAQVFANPMRVYFGCDQGGSANNGVGATYSEFKIAGGTVSPPIDDTFTEAVLDTTTNWILDASAPGNVFIVPALAGNQYWVNWTLPAVSFGLQVSTNLAQGAASFEDPGVRAMVGTTTESSVLVPGMTTNISAASAAYFNLIKRTFSQLQVLLPGETNAPGTLTGKTGTPTPVSLSASGGFETVTVSAVDSTFHIITSATDTVDISSSDPNAFLPNPAALVNGTVTIQNQLDFQDEGAWTVTASDQSNGGIMAGTSSPVSVGP
jgi:hypothetical protein